MMLPAAAARFWTADITLMLAVSTLVGIVSGYAGLLLSYHLGWPAGPAIILTAGAVYIFSLTFGTQGGLVWLARPGKHLEA
jgi:zinc/manganese transport system permease protein